MEEGLAYHLDIAGLQGGVDDDGQSWLCGRPWLGVQFDCCGVYARVYRNAEGTAYAGRCPRCTRHVSFRVGHGGTHARFFTAH